MENFFLLISEFLEDHLVRLKEYTPLNYNVHDDNGLCLVPMSTALLFASHFSHIYYLLTYWRKGCYLHTFYIIYHHISLQNSKAVLSKAIQFYSLQLRMNFWYYWEVLSFDVHWIGIKNKS